MSHRLGSVLPIGAPLVLGPPAGPPTSPPNTWVATFPVDPLAKFVMLHVNGAAMAATDRAEIELGYDTDVYTAAWGGDFWSRPVRGDGPVTIRFIRGAGGGSVTVDQYGRGEAMAGGGATNTNADVFLLASPFVDPTFHYAGGVFPPATSPTWENVACLPDGVMKTTARSVGMYIAVHEGELSSCTATLIAPDLVITAGHCISSDAETKTGSITFDFQTACDGTRPVPYGPKFHKLRRLVRSGYNRPAGDARPVLDYSVIQIETPVGGLGLTPVPIRPDVPPVDEPLFIIHHPRGITKKVSRHPVDADCSVGVGSDAAQIYFQCDVDNGSSGSSIFDSSGRIVANLSWWTWGISILAVSQDLITEPPPARDVDVVMVLDRSGSMSLSGFTGADKMTEAKEAAALFVSLLRTDATHRAGLVSFSTTPSADFSLAAVNATSKDALIGPLPPGTAGLIGGLAAGGATTIGGGLQSALGMFPAPGPAANTRAILLLTDGLENTAPMIAAVEAGLGGALLNIIGLGTEASLDGPGLTRLARNHHGIYTRAGEGLALKKFFALAFGRIFDFGTALDPEFFLGAGVAQAAPVAVNVCGESTLTAVLGWDDAAATLRLSVRSPGGSVITTASPGVTSGLGRTWAHLRVPLPFGGERDGVWQVLVSRPPGSGEFPPPAPALRFFITALAEGGPYFRPLPQPALYTGDIVSPRVALRYPEGGHLHADVTVEIERPTRGTGNILTAESLGAPALIDGDAVGARAGTLIKLEGAKGSALVPTAQVSYPLFDDGDHDDGGMEPDGIFGNPIADLTLFEGHYTFHARATYGHPCVALREATWTAYVAVGIDPASTPVKTATLATLPDGRERIGVTFTPRDRYGNHVGPGRADGLQVGAVPGSQPEGELVDQGDGSYTQVVLWSPDAGERPGVSIAQPGRPPIVVSSPPGKFFRYVVKFLCGTSHADPCCEAPVRPGVYATEINILNPGPREARVRKHVVPLVLVGAAIGREPRVSTRRAADTIMLPPHTATMDDCCRLLELLLGARPASPSAMPLTIGVLEILSTVELDVTAVYTASSAPAGGAVDIDVESIRGRPA